jgi:hypothetical protein
MGESNGQPFENTKRNHAPALREVTTAVMTSVVWKAALMICCLLLENDGRHVKDRSLRLCLSLRLEEEKNMTDGSGNRGPGLASPVTPGRCRVVGSQEWAQSNY